MVRYDTNTTYSGGTGITLSGTTFNLTDTAAKLNLTGGTLTGTLNSRDIKLGSNYHLQRSNHHSGHLEGSYNNIGDNGAKSNPIYTIGSSYNPADATLGNMYGIGYTHAGSATFVSLTGASGWGQYVAADGDARIFLDAQYGKISSTGEHYVGSSRVFHDTYHPNADQLTTARTISLAGNVTGSVSFNGSGNVSITTSLAANSVAASEIAANAVGSSEIAADAVGASEISASAVGASELNVSGNGSTSQFLRSDGDGTFSWVTPTDTNTVYTHPTSAGNKHVPTGGASGQFLKYSSSGTATWATPSYTTNTDTNTTYSAGTHLALSGTTFNLNLGVADKIVSIGHPSTANEAEIVINTAYSGSPQIGFTEHGDASWAIGIDDADNSFKISGVAGATIPVVNNLATPKFELTTGSVGYLSGNRIFADNYHPNADQLTTARTISLAGNVTGSVSFNGSGNVSITTSLAANSVAASEIAANAVGSSEIAADAVGASEISASAVGASELNVSGNGSTSQFLRSDGDGTFTWATPTDTNTVYTLPTTITGTRNFSGLISANAGLRLGDNDKIQLGDSQDLEINHYSVGQITNKTGDLYISSTAANTDIIFYAAIGATPTEFYRMNGGTGKNTFSRPVDISANLTATGDTGIGTTSPTELLHVRKAQSTSAATDPFIKLQPTSTTNSTGLTSIFLGCTTASSAYGISLSGWRDPTNSEAFAIKTHSGSANGTDRFVIRKNGYIGIGTSSPSSKLQVVGTLTATTKNFLIDNPKTGGELQYSVIESNEHGVSVRGESDQEEIQLPDEWEWLVHEDSVTVHLTSIDQVQHLFVLERNNIRVRVGGIATNGQYSYVISGTRKDVDPLEVHI